MENDVIIENLEVREVELNGVYSKESFNEILHEDHSLKLLRIGKDARFEGKAFEIKRPHKVKELHIEENHNVTKVSIFEDCPHLSHINIADSLVSSLTIKNCSSLKDMRIEKSPLLDQKSNYGQESVFKLEIYESTIETIALTGKYFEIDFIRVKANSCSIRPTMDAFFTGKVFPIDSKKNSIAISHSTIRDVDMQLAFGTILLNTNHIDQCSITPYGGRKVYLGVLGTTGAKIGCLILQNVEFDTQTVDTRYFDGVGSFISGVNLNLMRVVTNNTNILDVNFHHVVFTDNVAHWLIQESVARDDSLIDIRKLPLINYTQVANYREVLLKYHKKDMAENLRPLELGQLRKHSWESKQWLTWFMLGVNRVTNNYGSNYALPIAWYVVLSLLAYTLIFNPIEHCYFMADKYFYMLNPAHRFDILMEAPAGKVMDWMWNMEAAPYVDFFHRIVNGFLIFQIIRAFRRYTR